MSETTEVQLSGPLVFSSDRDTRHAQIRSLLSAPAAVREATFMASAEAAAPYYAESLANGGELTELTVALQGEPFHDANDTDYSRFHLGVAL